MRLIDADELKLNRELCTYERYTGIDEAPYEYAIRELKNAKTVDVNNLIIEELVKIKAEIEEHNRKYLSDDNAGLERAIWDFIEPHISELKGEQE